MHGGGLSWWSRWSKRKAPYRVGALVEVAGLGILPGQQLGGANGIAPPLQAQSPRETGLGSQLGRGACQDLVLGRPHLDAGDPIGPRRPLPETPRACLKPGGLECSNDAEEKRKKDDGLHAEANSVLREQDGPSED
jgi:hypothetical protein